MNVSLGMQWEQFVNEKVESGRYQTASEVLRDGLRLLEQREKALRRMSPQTKQELEEMLEKFYAEHRDFITHKEYEEAKENPDLFVALIDRVHRHYVRMENAGKGSS